MVRSFIALVLVLVTQLTVRAEDYPKSPNPKVTPGDLCDRKDPDFSEFRYEEKIPYCIRNVSTQQKTKIYHLYSVDLSTKANYTVDHFIPLALGGNNSEANLWPEHHRIKDLRKTLEQETYLKLENSEITQAEAIEIIVDAKMHPPIDSLLFE